MIWREAYPYDPNQEFSSEQTSRNSVADVFGRVDRGPGWQRGTVNLDLGGGRFEKMTEALKGEGVENLVLDPYNRPDEVNDEIYERLRSQPADTGTLANVLNVIREPEERQKLLSLASELVNGPIYITVYVGNSSGTPAASRDGWQENRPLASYLEEVQLVFPDAHMKGGMIVTEATDALDLAAWRIWAKVYPAKDVSSAINESSVGKKMHADLYVHRSAVGALPEILQTIVRDADGIAGVDWDLAKIAKSGEAVSLLEYPEFDADPHPGLVASHRVSLGEGSVKSSHFDPENPPILHHKETFVTEDYPRYEEFASLSEAEKDAGLLGKNDIGRRQQWDKLLKSKGLSIRDHTLVSS